MFSREFLELKEIHGSLPTALELNRLYQNFNVLGRVCVVCALDYDHLDELGNEIESIAWHKTGIYRDHAVNISSNQKIWNAGEVCRQENRKNGQVLILYEKNSEFFYNSVTGSSLVQKFDVL